MSRVVNLRDFGTTIARAKKAVLPDDVVRIDRSSPWGNPFVIGDWWLGERMTRSDVLRRYSLWLSDKLQTEPDFLEPLRGKRLACWCAPLPCHGDIILEFVA
jgi:hypothetical protein